jgi:hypothetical protein
MRRVQQWNRFEAPFEAARVYEPSVHQENARVEFRHEDGTAHLIRCYWDGGKTWRVRFSPEKEGRWSFRAIGGDTGIEGTGGFLCVPYSGSNPLYLHGAVRVAESGRYLSHADSTPFFWLGDTVWNGPLKAGLRDWAAFLRDRAAKGFNAIQFVPTQWVAGAGNADLRVAYTGIESIRIDPVFFQWLDARVDAINRFGMLAAPALIWSAPSSPWVRLNPGNTLPEDQIIQLARYLVARYGSHQVAWMLGADGDYRGAQGERWKRIGREVFEGNTNIATMHPMGQIWVGEEFESEPWFSFHGYQSSHYGSAEAMRWITEGPPSSEWRDGPRHPVINLEPCYEGHLDMCGAPAEGRTPFDAHAVRRACYWSVLASPPAGVTYGAHGVWGWELRRQLPMNHASTGVTPTWREGMRLPGSAHMKVLRDFFESMAWWTLLPAPEILAHQPGVEKAHLFVSAARSESGGLAVFYLPEGGTVSLRPEAARGFREGEWVNPETGERTAFAPEGGLFHAPEGHDWLLRLRGAGA